MCTAQSTTSTMNREAYIGKQFIAHNDAFYRNRMTITTRTIGKIIIIKCIIQYFHKKMFIKILNFLLTSLRIHDETVCCVLYDRMKLNGVVYTGMIP